MTIEDKLTTLYAQRDDLDKKITILEELLDDDIDTNIDQDLHQLPKSNILPKTNTTSVLREDAIASLEAIESTTTEKHQRLFKEGGKNIVEDTEWIGPKIEIDEDDMQVEWDSGK